MNVGWNAVHPVAGRPSITATQPSGSAALISTPK